MSDNEDRNPEAQRRRLLKVALASAPIAALTLPTRWTKPVVDSIIVPAHAATSPAVAPPPPSPPPPPPPPPAPSDVRLKTDIALVDRLPSGIDLFRFKYIGGDIDYVGVMAQQAREIVPEAVVEGPDGYLRVHYDALGLEMVTLAEWRDQREAKARAC